MTDDLTKYISADLRKVDGWLSVFDAKLIATVLRWQNDNAVSGCVGEIGVHHGKLLILLQLGAKEDPVFGVDLFEDQSENVDRSGRGDRESLTDNANRYGAGADALILLKRNSLELDWSELRQSTISDCRFFSVDGGHTADITLNDLVIADHALSDGGVICLDDYFNKYFPEVSVGLCRFMEKADIAPFAISENKVFLCRPDYQVRYSECVRNAVGKSEHASDTEFFGHPTPVLHRPKGAFARVKASRLARELQDTELGEALKPFVRRLFRRG